MTFLTIYQKSDRWRMAWGWSKSWKGLKEGVWQRYHGGHGKIIATNCQKRVVQNTDFFKKIDEFLQKFRYF